MSENVIFKKTETPPPILPPTPSPNAAVQPPPQESQPLTTPEVSPLEEDSGPQVAKIGMIIGGGVLVIALIFLFIRFVLPMFGKSSSGHVTLSYWGLWEDKSIMQPIIDDFQKENPNISVVYEKNDIKQYREKLTTRIGNGTGPDIFTFHNSWLPMFQKHLSPLPQSVIAAQDFKNIYYPVAQTDLVNKGAIYGLPSSMDVLSLFVNTEIFKAAGVEVPTNWNDFISVSKALTVKDESGSIKTAGAALGTYGNITHAPDIISLLLQQNGTNLYNLSATADNASQTFEFYTNFSTSDDKVWDPSLDPSILAFAKGNLAMYIGYSWDIFSIQAMNKDLAFSTHPMPNLPGKNMTLASYWVNGVASNSKHEKEAMLFLHFLSQKATMQKLYTEEAKTRLFGELYPREDLAASLKENSLLAPFVTQAPHAVSTYFASDTYDNGYNTQMNKYLENAINSMVNDNTSAKSAVETLIQGVSQIAAKYGQ